MADVTFTDVERLQATDAEDVPLAMDEEAFRAFYERTAPSLWGYLARISGDRNVADDLLQESYYRLLKARDAFESDTHRRNYLFRVATNLVRDSRRGTSVTGTLRSKSLVNVPRRESRTRLVATRTR